MPLCARHPASHSVERLEQAEPWPGLPGALLSGWGGKVDSGPVREHTGRPAVEIGWLWPLVASMLVQGAVRREGCWELQGRRWGGLQGHVLEGQPFPSGAQVSKNAGRSAVWAGFPARMRECGPPSRRSGVGMGWGENQETNASRRHRNRGKAGLKKSKSRLGRPSAKRAPEARRGAEMSPAPRGAQYPRLSSDRT